MTPDTAASTPSKAPAPMRPVTVKRYRAPVLFLAAIAVGLIVSQIPIASLSRDSHITFSLLFFLLVLWVGEVLPIGISAVIFCMALVVILGKRMPPSIVFSGFASPALWLTIGAFLLGEAAVGTGVVYRIAYLTMRLGKASHTRVLIFIWITGAILGLLVPSGTVRTVMFIPIIVAIVNAYKAPSDSRFAANLLLHVFWGNHLGALLWYTGVTQTPQIMGMLKSMTGYGPSYLVYVVWNFIPCVIFGVCLFFIIQWIMPPEKNITQAQELDMLDKKLAEMGKMSADEWTALIFFMAAVILWGTEPFHHIDTAWVALGLGGLLFMPGLGVLNKGALNKINWDVILLMAVAISFTGIMKEVKLDIWVVQQILTPILNPFVRFGNCGLTLGLAIIAGLLHFILSAAMGETALLAPIVLKYAHVMGYNTIIAALVTLRAELLINFFPYQGLPLVILWGTGYMDMRKCLRSFSVTSAFVIIWLVAMTPVWEWTINLVK